MTRLPTQPQVKGVGQSLASVFRHLNQRPLKDYLKGIPSEPSSVLLSGYVCSVGVICQNNGIVLSALYVSPTPKTNDVKESHSWVNKVFEEVRGMFLKRAEYWGTIVLVSRWHYKHRCFDLPHTGYLISLGAAPRCFHRLNLSSSLFVLLSCKEKQYFIHVYYAVAEGIFSVFLLITWTVHIWVFLNLLFDHVAFLHLYALAVMWLLQLEETMKAVVCPDQVSECPDDTTCCQLPDSSWGCCPLAKVTHISTNAISLPKITDSHKPQVSHTKNDQLFLAWVLDRLAL